MHRVYSEKNIQDSVKLKFEPHYDHQCELCHNSFILHNNAVIFILCNTLTCTSFIKNFCYKEQILVDFLVLYIRS